MNEFPILNSTADVNAKALIVSISHAEARSDITAVHGE